MNASGPLRIELHCRACGQPYEPTRQDILRGAEHYKRCPDCRPVEQEETSETPKSLDEPLRATR
jgi:uncharacterized Zn finger protein